jgi:hypothetical protein
MIKPFGPALVLMMASLWSAQANAHFKLLKPASALNEDSTGGPQKGAPCGPGGFDDVQPVPYSGVVTTFHAGETIQVDIQETVYHPGYFRVALAENRADFKDPPLTNAQSCAADLDAVMMAPHDNVLVDGIAKTAASGTNRHIMQDVKLPDKPCDKCTLQVVQLMKDHGPPSCFYYHCADIKILPATDAGAGAGAGGSSGATAGSSAGAGAAAVSGSGGVGQSGGAGSTATAGVAAPLPMAGRTGQGGGGAMGIIAAPAAGGAGSASLMGSAGATSAAGSPGTAGQQPAASKGGCTVARVDGATTAMGLPGLAAAVAVLLLLRRRRTV